jgi:hypothetical protein
MHIINHIYNNNNVLLTIRQLHVNKQGYNKHWSAKFLIILNTYINYIQNTYNIIYIVYNFTLKFGYYEYSLTFTLDVSKNISLILVCSLKKDPEL